MSNQGTRPECLYKEYLHVKRLISLITNDDSNKMIAEKLNGRSLTTLLTNAKIINSNNMAAKRKIIECVIRAIERENKPLGHKDLDQSWARKLLASFNCLAPVSPINNVHHPKSTRSRLMKKPLSNFSGTSKRTKIRSHKSTSKKCGFKSSSLHSRRSITNVKIVRCINRARYADDVASDVHLHEQVPIQLAVKTEHLQFESTIPLNLDSVQKLGIYVHPTSISNLSTKSAEKKTSPTQTYEKANQTFNCSPQKSNHDLSNQIKLQNLLNTSTNLMSSPDQREYVKSFLSNVEPPFDLSGGFPPYLKLPINQSSAIVGKESIYGSSSDFSVVSVLESHELNCAGTINDVSRQKHEYVNYVHDLTSNHLHDTAESIISGVINESLPHDKADYSQLGACILKRLGALPHKGLKDRQLQTQSRTYTGSTIPEIILNSTEWFETDNNEGEDEKAEHPVKMMGETFNMTGVGGFEKLTSGESIVEIKLLDQDQRKLWDSQGTKNVWFFDSEANEANVKQLDLSEENIVGIGVLEEITGVKVKTYSPRDRKSYQSEPLTTSPSGIAQENELPKKQIKNSLIDEQSLFCCNSNQRRSEEAKIECSKMELVSELSKEEQIEPVVVPTILQAYGMQIIGLANLPVSTQNLEEDPRPREEKQELREVIGIERVSPRPEDIPEIGFPSPENELQEETTVEEIEVSRNVLDDPKSQTTETNRDLFGRNGDFQGGLNRWKTKGKNKCKHQKRKSSKMERCKVM